MTRLGEEPWFVRSRAAALAEIFMAKLNADFYVALGGASPGDYQLTFREANSSRVKSLLVEVKGSNRKIHDRWPLIVSRKYLEWARRDEPKVLFIIADVVNEELYYGWGRELNDSPHAATLAGAKRLYIPIRKITEPTVSEIRSEVVGTT